MSTNTEGSKLPALRFPAFQEAWETHRIDWFLQKVGRPVQVDAATEYREIGVRSHGKGIFHKAADVGHKLGDKRVFWVEQNALVLNIVFAWEQAVALTGPEEAGFIASHRFPMFLARQHRVDTRFVRDFFLTHRGKYLLEMASPGGAGRNKTLGQSNFAELEVTWPSEVEQKRIAEFLECVDDKITLTQRRHDKLTDFKKAIAEKLFGQALRLNKPDGSAYPTWERKRLGDIAIFRKGKAISKSDISENGQTPCIRYGELYTAFKEQIDAAVSATDLPTHELTFSKAGDVILPASGETPLDMASAACVMTAGIAIGGDINIIRSGVNGLFLAYALRHAKRRDIAKLSQGNSVVHLYPSSLAHLKIDVPDLDEQKKIAGFLAAIDARIAVVSRQVESMQLFKRGLLQQMFV